MYGSISELRIAAVVIIIQKRKRESSKLLRFVSYSYDNAFEILFLKLK